MNPNSHFDPTKQLVLNPASWVDSPAGQFTSSSPYYNGYRWQRQPAESMAFARNFRFGKEGRYNLNTRIEFQNVFNRHFFSSPSNAEPSTPRPPSRTSIRLFKAVPRPERFRQDTATSAT